MVYCAVTLHIALIIRLCCKVRFQYYMIPYRIIQLYTVSWWIRQLQVTFTTDAERNRHFRFIRFGKVAERAERNNAERNSFDLAGSQKADFSDQKNFFRKVAERNDFAKMHKINFIHWIMQSVGFMRSVRSWYAYRFILYFFGICKHMQTICFITLYTALYGFLWYYLIHYAINI